MDLSLATTPKLLVPFCCLSVRWPWGKARGRKSQGWRTCTRRKQFLLKMVPIFRGECTYGGFHEWGYPQSSSLMGFSKTKHPFGGTFIYGNLHVEVSWNRGYPKSSFRFLRRFSCFSHFSWCSYVSTGLKTLISRFSYPKNSWGGSKWF